MSVTENISTGIDQRSDDEWIVYQSGGLNESIQQNIISCDTEAEAMEIALAIDVLVRNNFSLSIGDWEFNQDK